LSPKIYNFASEGHEVQVWAFHCPGCGYDHAFTVGPKNDVDISGNKVDRPRWKWNGSVDSPTFTPSLLCSKDVPSARCHSIVTDGKIAFCQDCWHDLKGKTVAMPDWD
jgi:hypothetical protein